MWNRPGRGDLQRHLLACRHGRLGTAARGELHLGACGPEQEKFDGKPQVVRGQEIIHKLVEGGDVFLNNLRPYEMEKFHLDYATLSQRNPRIIYANLTGYGRKGPEKNVGGYDSVAFWARSGVMDLMHEPDSAPNISRPAYGDSITSQSLLAGVMAALFHAGAQRPGPGSGSITCTTAQFLPLAPILPAVSSAVRIRCGPRDEISATPSVISTPPADNRWIMLGMTNSEQYWATFCTAIDREELIDDPRFVDQQARAEKRRRAGIAAGGRFSLTILCALGRGTQSKQTDLVTAADSARGDARRAGPGQ
jgi:crotonobetainyl-CoA:carnitine CoA-transferase CaiB-like acyl-CoA transferase